MEKQQIIKKIEELRVYDSAEQEKIEELNLEVATFETQARMKRDNIEVKVANIQNVRREIEKLEIALEILER